MGTIVTCPKCHSMVQVPAQDDAERMAGSETPPPINDLPQPPVALGRDSVDSGALTEGSISSVEPSEVASESPSGFTKPPPRFSDDQTAQANEDPDAPVDGLPPPQWQSQRSAKSRRIVLLSGASIAGVILLGVLVSGVWRSQHRESVSQVDPPAATQADGAESATDVNEDQTKSDQEPTGQSVDPRAEPSDTEPSVTNPSDQGDSPEESQLMPDGSAVDPINPSNAKTETATKDSTQNTSDRPSNSDDLAIPPELMPSNPLGLPDPLSDLLGSNSPTQSDSGADQAGGPNKASLTELPEDIRKLLGPIGELSRPHISPTREAPPTLDEVQLDRAADEKIALETLVNPRKKINMKQALGLEFWLNAKNPNGYSLNDFTLLISQWTRVPVEVQWVAFDLCDSPIDQMVMPPKGRLSVEQLIQGVCESIDAEFVVDDQSIRIQPSGERMQQAFTSLLDLSDLADGQSEAVAVARRLLGQEDGDVRQVGMPEQEGGRQLASLVCESIRRCRGAPGKLSQSVADRWVGAFKQQVIAWPLLTDGDSGETLVHDVPVASLTRRLARLNGATCFVNWSDLAKQGIGPADTVMPHLGKGIKAGQAISKSFGSEGLQIRIADGNHWWFGAESTFDRLPVAIWFEDDADAEPTREQIQAIITDAFGQSETYARVAIDPISGRCLAIVPRFILRQLPRLLQ